MAKLAAGFVMVVLCMGVAVPARCAQEGTFNRTFQVSPGGTLKLSSDLGSVQIKGVDGNRVELVVTGALGDVKLDAGSKDGNVTVKGKVTVGEEDRSRVRLNYVVSVPWRYNLQLTTAGGSVELAGMEGEIGIKTSGGGIGLANVGGIVKAQTSGGSIRAVDLEGQVDLRTSGGSIEVEKASAQLKARTSGGSITLQEVTGPVDAETSGGSVKAVFAGQPQGKSTLKTSGGSVEASLGNNSRVTVDARTRGGRFYSDFQLGGVRKDAYEGTLYGDLNGGGPVLKLRNSGGNIYLKRQQ